MILEPIFMSQYPNKRETLDQRFGWLLGDVSIYRYLHLEIT